ncbi:MAG: HAMP domain-containing histidine kinase [Aphanocapsa lilacina HA4352-LM1]|nr:HAMP domain-containing histidine kinase [Aphanocapsa lilacina HA4352-LM1]
MPKRVFPFRPITAYIASMFAFIMVLEFTTEPEYIFGYLYVGPILLANWFLDRRSTAFVTALSVALTLLNLVFPRQALASSVAVVDRLITVAALLTVAYLGLQYRRIQEEAARQKAALQTEEELSRAQSDFVATLTHDLKTPLLGAQQTLQFFGQEQFGAITPQQQGVIETLLKSNHKLLALVDTLLAIYRNRLSGPKLDRQVRNIDELCAEQIVELQDLALSRQIELVYEGAEGVHLAVDGLQLGRVVANLVGNAINHTPRGGRVIVRLLQAAAEVRLLVEDTGSGIPPTDIRRIFDRFYQSDNTRHIPGTGLGLYLSRQIVEAHGGRIWAVNRPGGGCLFAVALPAPTAGAEVQL